MSDIVNLSEHRPHMKGEAKCMNCKHVWTATAPQGTPVLPCPECECLKGVWASYCLGEKENWQCIPCGNEFFVLHPDRIMCANCGEPQYGMWE